MAKQDNAILTINYHKILDKDLIDWVKSKRNYSEYVRTLLYDVMKEENVTTSPKKTEIPKTMLTSIDNF